MDDPMELVRRSSAPKVDASVMRPSRVVIGGVDFGAIAIRPDHPGWKEKLPPPAPDPFTQREGNPTSPPPTNTGLERSERPNRRVVVSYGPKARTYVLAVEDASTGGVLAQGVVDAKSVNDVLFVLEHLADIKDLTVGRLYGQKAVGEHRRTRGSSSSGHRGRASEERADRHAGGLQEGQVGDDPQ